MHLSRRAAVLLAAVLLGPAVPSLATTTTVDVVEPLLRTSALVAGVTTQALDPSDTLVGITWDEGDPQVRVRWLTPTGWTPYEVPEDDSDVPEQAERATAVEGTEPLWRPPGATLVEVEVTGAATDLRLVRVGDGVRRVVRSLGLPRADAADARALLGGVRSRADWGADESIRRSGPAYASAVKAVVVHHTAGSNDYAPADVPRRIRADYAYHVKARGWSDLGYNLVVDKYGGIWEGRAGGLGRATVGSHSAGFNTGTLGVSLLGDMSTAAPTPQAVAAMARVSAYAAGTWQFDPTGSVVLTSGGSPTFSRGTRVTLGRVHGHRDTGRTACPGALYDRLGEVRAGAARLLGPAPRLLSVTVAGAPVRRPQPLVVTAELSRSTPWSAALRDEDGTIVARTQGEGGTAVLRWDGLRPLPGTSAGEVPGVLPALPGTYEWAVRADDGWHPPDRRTGTVELELLPSAVGST